MTRYLLPIAVLLGGCPAPQPEFGVADPSDDTGKPDDTGDTDTSDTDTSDTDTDTDSGDTGDTAEKVYNFDDAGDFVLDEAEESPTTISLADESGDTNQGQQFFAVLVNPTESDQSYNLRYILDSEVSERSRGASPGRRSRVATPREVAPRVPLVPRRDALSTADVGERVDVFRVRIDLTEEEWAVKDATLWALGDHIAIWVDNEVPIDWDYDCDGLIDEPDQYDAFGFDNCDLSTVADIFDLNIYPNLTSLYGDVSDEDGDGRIDLFLSPTLNEMPTTSDDEEEQGTVLPSYAEPSVDLQAYDEKTNKGSDEREVIYGYAPDPAGYYHNGVKVSIDEYTNYALTSALARSLVSLISYNQHILVNEGSTVEEDWLNDVLGSLGADRCGFGAPFHKDAWDYLDAPHNSPLLAEGSRGDLSATPKGAQYLFGLWLWDWAEANTTDRDAFFKAILDTEDVGTDAIEGALELYASEPETSFDDLVIQWQLALVGTGATNDAGDALLSGVGYTGYNDAEILSSIPADRDSLYGANGYQRGINIRGYNYAFLYGHTDSPSVEDGSDVLLGGTDPFHFDPAFDFNGWTEGNYAAQVVRLDGIPYVAAGLELQFKGDGFLVAVVRWHDATGDYAVENIYSPTDANYVSLPSLPDDGTEIYGLGELTEPDAIVVKVTEDDSSSGDVYDTDRWLLDLTDRPVGTLVYVQAWLDRRFNEDGDSALENPWLAVAPLDYVPQPTVTGTHDSDTCTGDVEFTFPDSLSEHLFYQLMLSNSMGSQAELTDVCGVPEASAPSCDADFDGDWVLDASEPMPTTFLDQVRVQQCTAFGGSIPSGVAEYDNDWLDADELDDDDEATYYRELNTGGLAGTSGEEGFVALALEGGEQYLLVVGSEGDTGLYELSVREIVP